jgi:UPF0148 protein
LSGSSKEKLQLTAELIKKGAIMLKEPCPTCNGVQIRYRDRVYCTSHEDLAPLLRAPEIDADDVLGSIREIAVAKMREIAVMLDKENELEKQRELVSLVLKYVELLKEIPERGETRA